VEPLGLTHHLIGCGLTVVFFTFLSIVVLREDVAIILNEREAAKAKIAELLELRFKALNITTSRIAVDEHTAAVVLERQPRLVVLDYLLGDVTTGLDILTAITASSANKRPRVVFLTDEPSINVAVQALKGGAEDYFEIDSPQAVQQVTALAERILRESERSRPLSRESTPALDELVAGAPAAQHTIRSVRGAITRHERGIILLGPSGSGLTTLARGATMLLDNPGAWSYIDLSTFLDSPAELPGMSSDPRGGIRPRPGHTVILDHAESDDGEVFTALSNGCSREPTLGGTIIVCTNDRRTADAFAQLTGGEVTVVPALTERRTDIGPLAQRFIKEAEILTGKKIEPLDSALILDLAEREWPANIRQLRTVVMNVALDSVRGEPRAPASVADHYTLSCAGVAHDSSEDSVDPLTAAAIFEATGKHYRRTAARLGCSIAAIRRALTTPPSSGDTAP